MTRGYYTNKRVDWDSFETDKFVPHLFTGGQYSCGSATLALLTGICNDAFNDRKHWSDKYMVNFLRDRGFRIQKLTMCNLTAVRGELNSGINCRHVIMASQLVGPNIASWSIMHNRLWYHNFDVCAFRGFSVINNPILTAYLLWHPTWMATAGEKGKL